MKIEYDPAKEVRNLERHGLGFDDAEELLTQSPLTVEDVRHDYGEQRFVAFGWIRNPLHVRVYTLRKGSYRIISLRKANRRKISGYRTKVLPGGEAVDQKD